MSPRRRSFTRHRAGLAVVGVLGASLLTAALVLAGRPLPQVPPEALRASLVTPTPVEAPSAPPAIPPPEPLPVAATPRADASLDRSGRTAFGGGYLTILPDFASSDGTYDLVVHFHGNTDLVEQSLAAAHIGAVFVPQNLGIGSGRYETRYTNEKALPELLARVQIVMERRGLAGAKLGRVALIAWSAGYGAVFRLLEHAEVAERVDAIVLLDAMHIGRIPNTMRPALEQLVPYERFARWAADGRKLFSITHSEITPGKYLGVREVTDLLLARVGVLRSSGGEEPAVPGFPATVGVLPKALQLPLHPMTVADRGGLHVRGYGGNSPETHMLHLLEMSSTALPDLAAWWARSRQASP